MGASQTKPKKRQYDVVIIGAGPAGLTAALYAGRARVKTVVLERGAPGGQLLNTEAIEDYPGFDHITGPELAQRMADQAVKFGVDLETVRVTGIRRHGGQHVVDTEDGEYTADYVILTAGGEPKRVGTPAKTTPSSAPGLLLSTGSHPNALSSAHGKPAETAPLGSRVPDRPMQPSLPGVYAAGDVGTQLPRQTPPAVGDATTAAIDA